MSTKNNIGIYHTGRAEWLSLSEWPRLCKGSEFFSDRNAAVYEVWGRVSEEDRGWVLRRASKRDMEVANA